MANYVKPVKTWQDIEKQVEIETANLVYFNYMDQKAAMAEAKEFVHNKYKDVINKLAVQKQ